MDDLQDWQTKCTSFTYHWKVKVMYVMLMLYVLIDYERRILLWVHRIDKMEKIFNICIFRLGQFHRHTPQLRLSTLQHQLTTSSFGCHQYIATAQDQWNCFGLYVCWQAKHTYLSITLFRFSSLEREI